MKEPGNANLVEPQIGRGLIGSSLFTSTMPIKFLLAPAPFARHAATAPPRPKALLVPLLLCCVMRTKEGQKKTEKKAKWFDKAKPIPQIGRGGVILHPRHLSFLEINW